MSTTTERRAAGQGWAAPGWYRDPADDEQLRWWSGNAWTDFSAPRPPVRPAPPAGAWYPDPKDPSQRLRWWDGEEWTDRTRDRYPGWPWAVLLIGLVVVAYLVLSAVMMI